MFSSVPSLPSPNQHLFSKVPHADIPRSVFNRSHTHKTTIPGDGYLIPIYVDEALPGDTFNLNLSSVIRFTTLLRPVMDNVKADFFFFAVPNRLVWEHWQDFMGEHTDAKGYQDTDYLVPVVTTPVGGHAEETIYDYMGIPIDIDDLDPNALHFRAYNLIYNEWFRDQNLIDPVTVNIDDGPDTDTDYALLKRGKRHDYFTSCLPWPQKGIAVDLPLGSVAPVITGVDRTWDTGGETQLRMWRSDTGNWVTGDTYMGMDATDGGVESITGATLSGNPFNPANLWADLSNATAATINSLREAFQLQKMMEREALGGTRYIEIIKSHFGVTSPDARLQRPEYLGGGTVPINIEAVPNTTYSPPLQYPGNLGAIGYSANASIGFTKSFTEHCVLLGLVNIRADITYQQGLNRMWSRQTKHDFYWPLLAHLGEQEVLNKELWANGTATDDDVFGYQERWAEYRYYPSMVTGVMRSDNSASLDYWHLALDFAAQPALNQTFIEEAPPFDRVVAVTTEPAFRMDTYFDIKCARPMPLYSVPGLIDHF